MAAAKRRSLTGALFDRVFTRLSHLPPETCSYTVTPVRIPIPDGAGSTIEFAADHFRPEAAEVSSQNPRGTILVLSPYGRRIDTAATTARPFAARGYQVLLVSCRGTFGSGGIFEPFRTEAADGQAVVAWMRKQAWYTGSFATVGQSYLAFTQWALLDDPPPDMVAAVMSASPHDFARFSWGTGALNMDMVIWSEFAVHLEDKSIFGPLQMVWNMLTMARRLRPIFEDVPLVSAVEKHFVGKAPWLTKIIGHRNPTDPYYQPMQHNHALDVADIPILLITGWQDIFLDQTMDQYRRLCARNAKAAMIVGPWTHISVEGVVLEALQWFDNHLAAAESGGQQPPRSPGARIFVTGAKEWRQLPSWPPSTEPFHLYLQPNKQLAKEHTIVDEGEEHSTSSFTVDPSNPTPTVGGPLLSPKGGSVIDDKLANRPDLLTFDTEPLTHAVEILGAPAVEITHTSDNPHVDLFVRISDVDGQGRSRNVTETYRRLDPEHEGGPRKVELCLRDCAHVFQKGHRIRLILAGANAQLYHRNPGTSEDATTATSLRSATHIIHHGNTQSSRLVLPVVTPNE
jgi:uncharacterized protein